MEQMTFGRTGLRVSRTGFGCIPIQRITYEESTALLRKAYECGITLFDTANMYTTSEDRIGTALGDVRKDIVICTKSTAPTPETMMEHLENSLTKLRTDYIDVYQYHLAPAVPQPGGDDWIYDCMLKAKQQGKIRFIGITCHKLNIAKDAVASGLFDTIQYPFSYLSTQEEMDLAKTCEEKNIGVLGMKALCGGILKNARAAFAFLRQYKNILPIWGIQKTQELDEFIAYEKNPPALDEALKKVIEDDKAELGPGFCRACGYCLPCPANIPIPMAARMEFLLGRMDVKGLLTPAWEENMKRIDNCTDCGHCKANCPYELDVTSLLKNHQKYFIQQLSLDRARS